MSLLLGVLGDPVLHSKSPQMIRAALAATGIEGHYLRLSAPTAADGLHLARQMGIAGLNVTAPFKEQLVLDDVDPVAAGLGAVNTVVDDGRTHGYCTDPDGVRGSLRGIDVAASRVLILGAGGAAKAAVEGIRGARDIVVWNRTNARAQAMAEELGVRWCQALPDPDDVDVVINCVSFDGEVVPRSWWRAEHTLLDATYARETDVVRDATAVGARILDGRDWLLYQGTAAFELMTGQPAPANVMRHALTLPEPDRRGNVALVGMMGSGKSTIARAMDWPGDVVDVDATIEHTCGAPIPEIFRERGEAYFRAVEADVVAQLRRYRHTLLVCGGGSVLNPASRQILREHSTVVWLWADASELAARTQGSARPILATASPAEVLAARMDAYADVAAMVVSSQSDPHIVAERITREIHYAGLAPR